MIAAIWTAIGGPRLIGWIAAGFAILVAGATAYSRIKSAGREEQRQADAKRTMEVMNAQNRVARPDHDELVDRLRNGRF